MGRLTQTTPHPMTTEDDRIGPVVQQLQEDTENVGHDDPHVGHRAIFSTTRLAKTSFPEKDGSAAHASAVDSDDVAKVVKTGSQGKNTQVDGPSQSGGKSKLLMRAATITMVGILGYLGYDYYGAHGTLPQMVESNPVQTPAPMELSEGMDADPVPKVADASSAPIDPVAAVLSPVDTAPLAQREPATDTDAHQTSAPAATAPVSAPTSSQPTAVTSAPLAETAKHHGAVASVSGDDLAKINERLERLSQDMEVLMGRLPARGAALIDNNAPQQPRPRPRPRTYKIAKATPPPAPVETTIVPRIEAQLLSVDLWDGRPSVVLGTTQPGDKRMRVLQPGESQAGIGLQSADVGGQKATFVIDGKAVTLSRTP